jgi:hypothetical protein
MRPRGGPRLMGQNCDLTTTQKWNQPCTSQPRVCGLIGSAATVERGDVLRSTRFQRFLGRALRVRCLCCSLSGLRRPVPRGRDRGRAGLSVRVIVCNTVIWWTVKGSSRACSTRRTRSRSIPRPRTCSSIRTWGSTTSMTCGPVIRCSTRPSFLALVDVRGGWGPGAHGAASPGSCRDPRRCRPIGCYQASQALAAQYRKDRR